MKRKELYDYVRGEIISELTTVTKDTQTTEVPDISKAEKINPASVTKAIAKAKATGKDVDIAEMARKAGSYSKGSKFDDAKEIYGQGLVSYVLKAIEELGETSTPANIAAKIKEYDPGVNLGNVGTILRNFRTIGVLSGGPLPAAAKPEKGAKEEEPEVEEPETEEPVDTWEKPEEEEPETGEEEPAAVSDKEVEKTVGTAQAQKLSPEDEDKYSKLKKGIDAKIARLKGLSAAKRASSDDMKVLKQLTNRDDVKKLFKAKGVDVKDLIADL